MQFFYIKTFGKKIGFCIWMKITMTAIIERQGARLGSYMHNLFLRNLFIYKNPETFQKARQFPLHFYIQKAIHLTLRDFHEISEVGIFHTKSMTLCVTWRFYIQKARHFAKSETICNMFLYTKIRHYSVTQFFIEFLKFAEGGGHLFTKNNNVLCVTFLYWKNNALCVTLLYTKSLTLCVTF